MVEGYAGWTRLLSLAADTGTASHGVSEEHTLLMQLVVVVALGGAAQWLAWRVRLPSILLLLLCGFLAGPVFDWVQPDELFGDLLLPFVSLAVAIILFEGGLTLDFRELRATGAVVRNLVLMGAIVTWIIAAAAAYGLLGFDWRLAVLAGAVLIVTGPTVIMPLLRHIRPTGPAGSILKWEGIVIDPVGALVTVLAFEVLFTSMHTAAPMHITLAVLKTVVVGGGLGIITAGVLSIAIARFWVPEFLHNAVALFLVCAVFAAANHVQSEAGLFAVTVMGIALANQSWADMRHIREFKENLRVFLISSLFILLAARLDLADLRALGLAGVAFVLVLVLAARPLGVLISTIGSKLRWRDKLFIAWMAPRGIVAAAVASVFAIQLEQMAAASGATALVEQARMLVPVTFTTIVGTVLVYGLTAPLVAQRLGVAEANPQGILILGAHRLARVIGTALQKHKFRVLLVDSNRAETSAAKLAELPTFHGNILGEDTLEELDLGGIGRLLALTPNDEVNVLAVQRFAPLLGRAQVYQLPPREGSKKRTGISKHLAGRWLFNADATAEHLRELLDAGAVVKVTKLTESFDFKAFRMHYGVEAIPLFLISETGRISVRTAEQTTEPKVGQTLVSLVMDPGKEKTAEPV